MKKIAILSGKGGSGKTFISTNLFNVIDNATYLDCDVEEPNGHIFFNNLKLISNKKVYRDIPVIDESECNGCRDCVSFCKFSALAFIKDKPLVFDEVCHSCGGCELVCTQNAIKYKQKEVGSVQIYSNNNKKIVSGNMAIGEASAIVIIEQVMQQSQNPTIIDCPPGSSCSTMESIRSADYCIIVAEPTIFSLHNIQMIVELVDLMNIPFSFILNKSDDVSDYLIENYIESINKELLIKIPFDKNIAKLNSNGKLISSETEEGYKIFKTLKDKLNIKEDI